MKKVEECEYSDANRCKALIKEGVMSRGESCLNEDKTFCCYHCSRKNSCETSCDYLDSLEMNDGSKPPPTSLNKTRVNEAGVQAIQGRNCPKCGGEIIEAQPQTPFASWSPAT